MEIEQRIEDHETRIHRLEDGQSDIRQRISDLSDQIKEGNSRNDENNKFLREQNSQMLSMLGGIQQKKQEVRVWTWQAIGKIAVTVGGVVSVVTIVVNYIFSK
jgi:chromosome segregation ATPase